MEESNGSDIPLVKVLIAPPTEYQIESTDTSIAKSNISGAKL